MTGVYPDDGASQPSLAPPRAVEEALHVSEVATPAEQLRTSARGWHGVQLAVLGFIGLCGVLQRDSPGTPHWVQVVALVLVLLALVLACLATVTVASVAWPLSTGGRDVDDDAAQLRRGLILTFVAVAVLALGTVSGWWPQSGGGGGSAQVAVTATDGQHVCGVLTAAGPGRIGITTGGTPVAVALSDVAAVAPADGC
jgi:hypothetical protein